MDKTKKNIDAERKCKIILEAISDYFNFKIIDFGLIYKIHGFVDSKNSKIICDSEQTTITGVSYSKLLGKVISSKEFLVCSNDNSKSDLFTYDNPFFDIQPTILCLKLSLLGYDMTNI